MNLILSASHIHLYINVVLAPSFSLSLIRINTSMTALQGQIEKMIHVKWQVLKLAEIALATQMTL